MGRNSTIADQLQRGETVSYRAHGNSMVPIVRSGQKVTVEPIAIADVSVGDAVFCKVRGSFYLHLVTGRREDGSVQISNNHGHVNGWTRSVFGKLTRVEN